MVAIVKRLVVPAIVLGLAGGGYALATKNGKTKKAEVTYETGTVGRGDIRSFVTATGIIQPWKIVDIKSNVDGRIDRLYVDIGQRVKAGDPIMDIDPTNPKVAKRQAEADIKSAKARQAQAQANLDQQKLQVAARILSAKKSVKAAEARLAQAEASKEVQPALTDLGIAQAKASLVSARKAVTQAEFNRDQLKQRLEQLEAVTIPFNIESVEANVSQAKANVLTAERNYRRQRELLAQGYVARGEVEAAYAQLANNRTSLRTWEQRKETLERENRTSIAEVRAQLSEAGSRIEETQARVDQAQAALELAQKNAVQNKIRDQEYESALASVDQTKAELESAEAERKQIDVREQEILTADAQLVRGEAALDQAETNLGFTRIVAPGDGIIITKNVEQGTVVPSSRASIGSTNALLQIGYTNRLWVVCSVDETDIGQVRQDQKVTVRVDAYPSMLIDGKVIRIDPQAKIEQNVTMIPVTVEISEPDERFKPGMNAECEFIVDEVKDVITVPNEALKENEGVYKVQKMENETPVDVEVEVGLAGQDVTEVRSGLKEGDTVVTKTIEPEAPQANNPFGSPFGGPPRRSGGGSSGGGRGGGGGGRSGGRGG